MQKIFKFFLKNIFIILIILISIFSFVRMLRPGIFSMQDFPVFRQIEYDRCIEDLQIPCRWAPDSAMGYGEPVFNFYGQFTFFVGSIFHALGASNVNSLKIVIIISFVGSMIAMFFLAKHLWKDNFAALISSVIYLYAPYRSLDVWVRGAYAEAFAFIFFPLIILFADKFIESKNKKDLLLFSLFVFILIITHNLSFVMFLPFLGAWVLYRLISLKRIKLIFWIIGAGILSLYLSAFYILPVVFESKFVDLQSTVTGYFYFAGHFPTLYEIFISRFWGYGASLWGPVDDLSLSLGQIQWILPLIIAGLILFTKRFRTNLHFFVLIIIGLFYIFIMHDRSTFIWNILKFMEFIQFPWRFLGAATFTYALASGAVVQFFKNHKSLITIFIVVITVVINVQFFREDNWHNYDDKYFTSSWEWDLQRTASMADYWPNYGEKPHNHPEEDKSFPKAEISKTNYFKYNINNSQPPKDYLFPVAYFPGWSARIDGKDSKITPAKPSGFISVTVPNGTHAIELVFKNTPVRTIGNVISLSAIILWLYLMFRPKWKEKI